MPRRAGIALGALLTSFIAAQAQTVETVTVVAATQEPTLSTTGFTSAKLHEDGVNGLFDLGQAVPGLRVDRYGGSTQATIRGLGVQNILGPGVNSDVAIYVDGFYQSDLNSGIFDFADVARIDVLKGPQGTQFGQNATAGAILLTTADPDFGSHGFVSASYGAFNDHRVQGYGTTALSREFAADLSVAYRASDNYFTDITTGKPSAPIENLSVRSKLLFQPSAGTRLVLSLRYSDMRDPGGLAYVVHQPIAAFYHDAFGVPMTTTETPYKTSLGRRIGDDSKTWSATLAGDFDLDWAKLTTRTQFRKERAGIQSDLDGTTINYWNVDYLSRDQTLSQEFDFAGTQTGPLQWQAGFYYSNDLGLLMDNIRQDIFNTGAPTSLFHNSIRVATDSIGLFGSVTYALADDWQLTAGGRFTHDRKSLSSMTLNPPFIPGTGNNSWDAFTPRLALRHVLDADTSVYASASRGFKSGSFDFLGVGPQTAAKPTWVTQYEAGYKHDSDGWSLDAATYLSDYRDLNVYTYSAACGCFRFSNARKAQAYGVEASSHVTLDENIDLSGAVAWTHARYQDFTGENPTGAPYIPPRYGYQTGPTDFAGDSMIRSPDWTGNVGLDWHKPTDIGQWSAGAHLALTSRVPFTPDRKLSQAGYALLNLNLGWKAPDGQWSLAASGQNITGKRYQTFSAEGLLGNSILYGAPATWSLQATRSF